VTFTKGLGICLCGIRDNLYKSPTTIEIMFYLVYVVIETTFSTTYRKEEVNVKSYVKMVIIYRWYVFESMSFRCP